MIRLLTLFLLITALAASPFPPLYRWIFEGDALKIKTFFVVETEHIKPDEVREYLKDFIGKPLYGVDLKKIAEVVEHHPWVSSVALRRSPPHEIIVEPIERRPIALASIGSLVLVDDKGILFQIASSNDADKWPIIKSKKQIHLYLAVEALKYYYSSLQTAGKISEIQFDESDSLHVIFASGIHAELGDDKFKEKWQKLDTILNSLGGNQLHLAHIYLGNYPNPHQVAVKFDMDNDSKGYTNGSTETR